MNSNYLFFQFLPNLKKFSIKSSKLQEIGDESFEKLEKVKELVIVDNNLKGFNNKAFKLLANLEVLDMSNNFIETLPGNVFENFTNLKALNFNHNRLVKLESSRMLPRTNVIEKFEFRQNLLTLIDPQIIRDLNQVKLIDLSGNKCIDTKYDQGLNNVKKVMEVFGEIHFKCIDGL